MKKITTILTMLITLLIINISCSEIETTEKKYRLSGLKNYTESFENFTNPERGLQKYSATTSNNINSLKATVPYNLLNASTLNGWKNSNDKVTVVYRYFILPSGTIPQSYLTNMQTDFNRIRNAGMSCIVRFSYTNKTGNTTQQPTKSIILSQIQQLSPIVNTNKDVIFSIQCGFIGTWGEWYYTNSTEFGTNGSVNATQTQNRKDIVNAMLTNFNDVFLQVRYASALKTMFPNGNSRIGFYNDAFLNEWGDMGTYSISSKCTNPQNTIDYNYIANITKNTPMTGETNGISTCSPLRSTGTNAIKELNDLNFTTLNRDYYIPMWNNWITSNHYNEIVRRLGYRFVLVNSNFTSNTYSITVKNVGFANMLKNRKVTLIFENETNSVVVNVNTDIRNWTNETTLTGSFNIPFEPINTFIAIEGGIRFANTDVIFENNKNKL